VSGRRKEYRFVPGQRVIFLRDVPNDGFYRHFLGGELLVAEGDLGEILNIGFQEEGHRVVYFVECAPEKVIGCFEEDLVPLGSKEALESFLPGPGTRRKSGKGEGRGRNL
jgi:nitrogen fixation protein NifZ